MEVRELIRLKEGTGGLEHPRNIAILLSREKSGKEHIARIFTINGEMTVKWRNLKEGMGRTYKGDKKDHVSMVEFLENARNQMKKGNVIKLEPQEIIDRVGPKDLWERVLERINEGKVRENWHFPSAPSFCEQFALTPEEIGGIYFAPGDLETKHIGAISKVLSSTNPEFEPYFHGIHRGATRSYLPYKRETLRSARKHIMKLEELRSVFLETVEEEDERGNLKRKQLSRFENPLKADLVPDLADQLDIICTWCESYLRDGKWKSDGDPPFGLGDSPIRNLEKFELESYVWGLAHHLSGCEIWDLPSDLCGLLLRTLRIDIREASELIVKFNLGSGKRKFHASFPAHVSNIAGDLQPLISEDESRRREDLRYLTTYTIDPDDAKDFDDAVSISREGGDWIIWIHIADVTHYVRDDGLIDDEARYRGTSVYLPTGVIPMLPKELSEDLCSLKKGVDRLAVSTKIVLSDDFEVLSHRHCKSIIEVDENLSYEQVDGWIEDGREPFISLEKVSKGLKRRFQRVDIQTPERRIRFRNGSSLDIRVKRPTKATELIEQLMVLTNEIVARTLRDNNRDVAFRVHPMPDRVSVERFNNISVAMGLDIALTIPEYVFGNDKSQDNAESDEESLVKELLSGGKISIGSFTEKIPDEHEGKESTNSGPKVNTESMKEAVSCYGRALREIDERTEGNMKDLMRLLILRTMPKAFYSEANIGHFGLGSECYCHFTSPIRRYPDILVHRELASILEGQVDDGDIGDFHHGGTLSEILENVNEMSEEAESWEREMINVALGTRLFMDMDLLKGKHSGMITSITPSMVYILLDDGVTEGRIPIRSMSDLRLDVDEDGSRVFLDPENNPEMDTDDPIYKKILNAGGDEITILKLGDRRSFRIRGINLTQGTVELALEESL
jgi:exoribonuclease R